MATDAEPMPDDVDTLKAELAAARARASADQALIAHQQLQSAKLQHQLYGQRSERGARLLGQMELGLEETQATATEDELAAEQAAARTSECREGEGGAAVSRGGDKPSQAVFVAIIPSFHNDSGLPDAKKDALISRTERPARRAGGGNELAS